MSKNKEPTIAEIAADLADDPPMKERVEREIERSRMITLLSNSRLNAGISQKALAELLGWSTSKISRIESGTDDQISFQEAMEYLSALGLTVNMITVPAESSAFASTEQIRFQVLLIQRQLEALRTLTAGLKNNEVIAQKISEFRGEVLLSILTSYEYARTDFRVMEAAAVYEFNPRKER